MRKHFDHAAEHFLQKYAALTKDERSPNYVVGQRARLKIHLPPFFGRKGLSTVTAGAVQDYRVMRMSADEGRKLPSRSTLHHEIVTLRQVMKSALRQGWIEHLPEFSAPYKMSGKITHRAWFRPRNTN